MNVVRLHTDVEHEGELREPVNLVTEAQRGEAVRCTVLDLVRSVRSPPNTVACQLVKGRNELRVHAAHLLCSPPWLGSRKQSELET